MEGSCAAARAGRGPAAGRVGQHLGQLPAARSRAAAPAAAARSASTMHCSAGGHSRGGRRRRNPHSVHPSFLCQLSIRSCLESKALLQLLREKDRRGREKKVIARLPGRGTANCFQLPAVTSPGGYRTDILNGFVLSFSFFFFLTQKALLSRRLTEFLELGWL